MKVLWLIRLVWDLFLSVQSNQANQANQAKQNKSLTNGSVIEANQSHHHHLRHNHHHHHSHEGIEVEALKCDRSWPSLALFVPIKFHENSRRDEKYYDFEALFLRTLLFFWPLKVSNTSLLLVYDEESSYHHYLQELKDTMKGVANRIPGGVKFVGAPLLPYYYGSKYKPGYNRQQYNMFWADNFTNAEYVGFCDTDAAFLTYVDREDLWENGKPVINGRSGILTKKDMSHIFFYWSEVVIGIREPMNCMSYFPMIVKTSHLKLMREHIAKRHNKTFDDAFHDVFGVGQYSQFCVICTYLWGFHRDEYTWYVHSTTPDWDGINPPPVTGQDGNMSSITEQMKRPKPRIATHVSYRTLGGHLPLRNNNANLKLIMQRGYCRSPPFPKTEPACQSIQLHEYYDELHTFESINYFNSTSMEKLNYETSLRHNRIKNCTYEWDSNEVQAIFK